MPSMASITYLLAVAVGGVSSLRRGLTKANQTVQRAAGDVGEVAGLFTFGAPAGSDPGMTYPKGDGCFPGLRMVAARTGWLGAKMIDFVPPLTRPLGFKQPLMRAAKLYFEGERDQVEFAECGDGFNDRSEVLDFKLHGTYPWEAQRFYPRLGSLAHTASTIALMNEGNTNPQQVADGIRPWGFSLAASVYDGVRNSHLIQERSTKNCFLTFQGTKSNEDWLGNVQVHKVNFCGLPERVHKGFRDNLLAAAAGDEWQRNIRGNLPSCSNVYLAGWSLGGITSQFMAACVAKAPKEGELGYEDYRLLGWTTGDAKSLAYPWD